MIYTVSLLIFMIFATSIHEYIHFYFANKYHPCKAIISSQFNFYKKNPKIKWFKRSIIEGGGHIFLDNDFLPYTDKQIVVIAIMPTIVIAVLNLIWEVALLPIVIHIAKKTMFWKIDAVLYVIVAISVTLLYSFHGRNMWCDKRIVRNPKGFKEHMEYQHKTGGADSYQYALIHKGGKHAVQKYFRRPNKTR